MLWVDKYRPKRFENFLVNQDIAAGLRKLVEKGAQRSWREAHSKRCEVLGPPRRSQTISCDPAGDFPHLLLYGPPGAGKKTLMKALLHQIYGPGAEKVKVETKPWKIELPTRKLELELMTLSSNYHQEMNPSDVGNNDRYALRIPDG
jgi:replication factor C subunit 3/5